MLPGQIDTCEPPTGVVEGDTVRWRFEDFEPANRDHDILLRFIQPEVLPLLADLRRRSAEAPGNTRRKLELIKHLLALNPARYTLPLLSSKMRWNEYVEALAMLRPGRDRARFQALFVLRADGYYHEKNSDWTQDADELTSMFSAVGYVEREWRWPFFAEGLGMLTQLLRDHPHNADAWNMYIQQSVGEPEWGFYPYQWERIEAARNNCPDDPAIRLWESLYLMQRRLRHDQSPGITPAVRRFFAKKEQLYRLLRRRGIVDRFEGFAVRYHSVSDKYF